MTRPVRLGPVSAAARLSDSPCSGVNGAPVAGDSTRHAGLPRLRTDEFRLPAPGTVLAPGWLKTMVVLLGVMALPLVMLWQTQPEDRVFELAAGSSHGMKDGPAQWSEPEPRLVAQGSRGTTRQPVPLGLTLRGRAAGGSVVIGGLVPGMILSMGTAVGVNAWQVPLQYLADTWIGPPEDFVGEVKLVAELHLADGILADRQVIHLEWLPATAVTPEQEPIASTPVASEQGPNTAALVRPVQVSPVAISPEPGAAPPLLGRDEVEADGSENPRRANGQHAARIEKRAASSVGAAPSRNEEAAKASSPLRTSGEPFDVDRRRDVGQGTRSKWQIIRHCWSVGQLVESSSTSTPSCLRSLDIASGLTAAF